MILRKLGEVRLRLMRVAQYFNLATFIGTIFTVVKVYDLPMWCVIFIVPVLVVLYYVDGKHAVSGEIEYMNNNNAQWQELRANITKVLETK